MKEFTAFFQQVCKELMKYISRVNAVFRTNCIKQRHQLCNSFDIKFWTDLLKLLHTDQFTHITVFIMKNKVKRISMASSVCLPFLPNTGTKNFRFHQSSPVYFLRGHPWNRVSE